MRIWKFHIYDIVILALVLILVWRHWPQPAGLAEWKAAYAHMMRGEYELAAKRFDDVIQIRPDADRAYFYRGLSLYFAGHYTESEAEFNTGLRSGGDAYGLYWKFLARQRRGGGGEEDLATGMKERGLDPRSWPGILGAALLGQADETAVMTQAAASPPNQRAGRMAEAYFYLAQRRLMKGDETVGRALLRRTLETRAESYIEYMAAAEELRRLGSLPPR